MELAKFDSYKHAIETLCPTLGVSRTTLAGMLGITERSLSEWENLGTGDSTPKSKRLLLLYNVVRLFSKEFPKMPAKAYKEVLENSRVIFDPDDEEDGSISLINLIVAEPEEKCWVDTTKHAVGDYLAYSNERGRKIETNRPIQIAK